MSKRARQPRRGVDVTPDYWELFLRSKGLLLDLTPTVSGSEEVTMPKDPRFAQYLREAGRWGAPKMADFLKLPAADKAYYLKAFSLWLEEMKKMKRAQKPSLKTLGFEVSGV